MFAPNRDALLHSLIRYALRLGLSERTVRVVFETGVRQPTIADGDRPGEIRKWPLAEAV